MKTERTGHGRRGHSSPAQRAGYATPRLTAYGKLARLTAAPSPPGKVTGGGDALGNKRGQGGG